MSDTPRTYAKWAKGDFTKKGAAVAWAKELERETSHLRDEIAVLRAKLAAAQKDAERYRRIRLKAWLDSCVDDLYVGTPQAKESEFNAGFDQETDAPDPAIDAAIEKETKHG